MLTKIILLAAPKHFIYFTFQSMYMDIYMDASSALKVHALVRAKDTAVAKEDYDTAKSIKASIEKLVVRMDAHVQGLGAVKFDYT